MNWKLKRKGTTTKGLEKQIDLYFSEDNEEYMRWSIEMLYVHIGVNKQNVYDWGKSKDPELNKRHELIKEAKEFIHSYLAHRTMNSDNANNKSKLLYLKSRFKDNGEGESEVQEKVTINIGNKGPNALLGDKDA